MSRAYFRDDPRCPYPLLFYSKDFRMFLFGFVLGVGCSFGWQYRAQIIKWLESW